MGICKKREFPWPICVPIFHFPEKDHGRCAHLGLFVKIAKELTGPPLKPAMECLQNTAEQEVSGGVLPALMYTGYIYNICSPKLLDPHETPSFAWKGHFP